jgi:hypothetical protein
LVVDPRPLMEFPAAQRLFDQLGFRDPNDLLLPAVLLLIGTAVISTLVRLLLTWCSQKFIYGSGTISTWRYTGASSTSLTRCTCAEIAASPIRPRKGQQCRQLDADAADAGGDLRASSPSSSYPPAFLLLEPVTRADRNRCSWACFIGAVTFGSRAHLRRITERWSALLTSRTKLVRDAWRLSRHLDGPVTAIVRAQVRDMDLSFETCPSLPTSSQTRRGSWSRAPALHMIGLLALY